VWSEMAGCCWLSVCYGVLLLFISHSIMQPTPPSCTSDPDSCHDDPTHLLTCTSCIFDPDSFHSDPFCYVEIQRKRKRTPTIAKDLNPVRPPSAACKHAATRQRSFFSVAARTVFFFFFFFFTSRANEIPRLLPYEATRTFSSFVALFFCSSVLHTRFCLCTP
jgi:hypothetical protein